MWQMLYYASYSDHEDDTSLADIKANPDLTRHIAELGFARG